MLETYLQEIGLNEKEAIAYLALLRSGSASVIDIAENAKINRSTTYTVLESLAKKGLVGEMVIGKKTRYQALSPKMLGAFIEKQKTALEEQSKRLAGIIPQLSDLQKSPEMSSEIDPLITLIRARKDDARFIELLKGFLNSNP